MLEVSSQAPPLKAIALLRRKSTPLEVFPLYILGGGARPEFIVSNLDWSYD